VGATADSVGTPLLAGVGATSARGVGAGAPPQPSNDDAITSFQTSFCIERI
jgi:hypothetical protein